MDNVEIFSSPSLSASPEDAELWLMNGLVLAWIAYRLFLIGTVNTLVVLRLWVITGKMSLLLLFVAGD